MMKNRGKLLDGLLRRGGELLDVFATRRDGGLLPLPRRCLFGYGRGALLALLFADLLTGPLLMVIATLRHTHPR